MNLDPRTWTLGARIGVALVVAALVPMAVLSWFSIDAGRQAVETAQLDSVEGSATESAVAVREYLAGVSARADALGTRPDVVEYLKSVNANPFAVAPATVNLAESGNSDVAVVTLAARDGSVTDSESSPTAEPTAGSVADQGWFTDAVAGRPTVVPPELNPTSGVSSVTVAAPARNPGEGVIGVAAIEVRGLDVLASLNQAQLAPGGQSWLVDANGRVLMARDSRVVGRTLDELGLGPLQTAISQSSLGTLTGVDLVGRGLQVAAFNEVTPGVTAVVLQPEAVFLGPIDRLGNITWLLFTVVGVLAVVGAVVFARRLSRPVGVLTAAAVRIESDEPVDAEALAVIGQTGDDVGRLARVFARMAEQVAVREKKLREQVRQLKVEIDQERRQKAVDEVTGTDFFKDLQGRAAEMRRRAKGDPGEGSAPAVDPPDDGGEA